MYNIFCEINNDSVIDSFFVSCKNRKIIQLEILHSFFLLIFNKDY